MSEPVRKSRRLIGNPVKIRREKSPELELEGGNELLVENKEQNSNSPSNDKVTRTMTSLKDKYRILRRVSFLYYWQSCPL